MYHNNSYVCERKNRNISNNQDNDQDRLLSNIIHTIHNKISMCINRPQNRRDKIYNVKHERIAPSCHFMF